jgi:hypothetical protein
MRSKNGNFRRFLLSGLRITLAVVAFFFFTLVDRDANAGKKRFRCGGAFAG